MTNPRALHATVKIRRHFDVQRQRDTVKAAWDHRDALAQAQRMREQAEARDRAMGHWPARASWDPIR